MTHDAAAPAVRIVREFSGLAPDLRGAVIALGNFDGVHLGHQTILTRTRALADAAGTGCGVMTFEPHPRRVFLPKTPPFRLTPLRSKARLLQRFGADTIYCLRFNHNLYSKHAEVFVKDVLADGLATPHVVVGYDFVFGYQRSGNAESLQALGEKFGFAVTVIDPVTHQDDVCSSTIIRVNLESGRTARAAELLGHWWEIEGRVRTGDQRGRQLGFPTLNLHLRRNALQPALGVYAVYVGLNGPSGQVDWLPAVANLGRRPTFNGQRVVLEVHVFDFEGDLYGQNVRIAFIEHIRPEKKFPGIDALRDQIAADKTTAQTLLNLPNNAIDVF